MNLIAVNTDWCRHLVAVLLGAMVFCLPGYVAGSDRVLKLDPGDVTGLQNMPTEIAALLKDLGYKWVPVHDAAEGHGLEVALVEGQYRMKFRAVDDKAVTIDVHIRISDNVTGFYYHDAADEPGDVSPQSRYGKLRERLSLEFGADSISEGYSFFTP